MTEQELEQLLHRCKNTLETRVDVDDAARARSWSRISHELHFTAQADDKMRVGWREQFQLLRWQMENSVLQPLAVGLTAFTLIFSGWVATVNASANTVPGDFLYPVKLATEQIQLTLANDAQRARLHTEFASRRLDEVLEITGSTRDGKEVRVREAVEGFKQEIASASAGLGQIATQNPEDGVEIAKAVDRRVDEFSAIVEQSDIDPSLAEHQEQVEAALPDVEQTQEQVAEVIISSQESTPQPETEAYLQTAFQNDLAEIRTGTTSTYGRLSVIEGVLESGDIANAVSYDGAIQAARVTLSGFDAKIADAMDLFAAGGYRRALQSMADLQTSLSTVQEAVTAIEIDLSGQLSQATEPSAETNATAPSEPDEPEAEEPSDTTSTTPAQTF